MKKTLIILSLTLAAIASFSQYKSDTTLSDTTKFISMQDINIYLNNITDKISVKQYNDFLQIMQGIIATAKKEWEEDHKKKK